MQPFVSASRSRITVFQLPGQSHASAAAHAYIDRQATGKQSDERSWFYFDQERSLLTRWGGKGTIGGVEAYMDYRATSLRSQVNGVLLPKQIDLLAENAAFGSITFDSITCESSPSTPRGSTCPAVLAPLLRHDNRGTR